MFKPNMTVHIKDKKYINKDKFLIKYLIEDECEYPMQLINGLQNQDKLTTSDTFKIIDNIEVVDEDNVKDFDNILLIKNDKGIFTINSRFVNYIKEDVKNTLLKLGYKRLIRSANKTILIDENDNKFITTKVEEDVDDPEKAVMIVLLKSLGFNIKDVNKLTELFGE